MFAALSNISLCLVSCCFALLVFRFSNLLFFIHYVMFRVSFALSCLLRSVLLHFAQSCFAWYCLHLISVRCVLLHCLGPFLFCSILLLLRISHFAILYFALQSFDGFLLVLLWVSFCLVFAPFYFVWLSSFVCFVLPCFVSFCSLCLVSFLYVHSVPLSSILFLCATFWSVPHSFDPLGFDLYDPLFRSENFG